MESDEFSFTTFVDGKTNNGFKHWSNTLTHVAKSLHTWAMEILKRSVMIHNPVGCSLNE